MSEERNAPPIPPCQSGRNSTGGRGGRGDSRGARQSSSRTPVQDRQLQRQTTGGRGRGGRGSGRHGRPPDSSSSPNDNPRSHPRANRDARSHSHHSDSTAKRSADGPYGHLFRSERHGFALSRVLFPPDEASLLTPVGDSKPASSAQLEKWWEAVKVVRCLVAFDQSQQAADASSHGSSSSSSLDRCPICLDDQMTCPHVAPCGHSFCLPCVLGYLHAVAKQLNDEAARTRKAKQWRDMDHVPVGSVAGGNRNAVTVTTVCARCPMCSAGSLQLNAGDAVITYRELRPLVFVPVAAIRPACGTRQRHPRAGTRIRFVKLHRLQTCLAPYLPLSGHGVRGIEQGDATTRSTVTSLARGLPNLPDGDDDAEECIYSRQYFVGSNEYDIVLQRNLDELMDYRDKSIHCQIDAREKWNASMAIEAIQASIRRWTGNDGEDGGFRDMELAARVHSNTKMTAVDSITDDPDNSNLEEDNVKHTNNALVPPGTAFLSRELEECFFYQACDGQLAFLSGINVACLLEEFSLHRNEHSTDQSSVSRRAQPLPDSVEGTVVGAESFVVTPSLVKKKHFLSHLPIGLSVVFVEIDWYSGGNHQNQPMLTKATLSKFRSEIQRRERDRQRAFQMEEKAQKLSQIKLDKEERRRREEAFGSASVDGVMRQTIDPDDEFFKAPTASTDESLVCHGDQHTSSLGFKFNEVCATGGVWPELSAAAAAPVTPEVARVSMARSPPSLPSWGNRGVKHSSKHISVVASKMASKIEPFPLQTDAVRSKICRKEGNM